MKSFCENRHSIKVLCEHKKALLEIIKWGEAEWWPKNSLMRFTRYTKGDVGPGTRYSQKVLMPFAPEWDVEVTGISEIGITRRFLNGMFNGEETVSLETAGDGLNVCYVMKYSLNGIANKILWPFILHRLHDRNIEAILYNLKKYLEGRR